MYNPQLDDWDEERLTLLPDEDERYEFKSGKKVDDFIGKVITEQKFVEDISKEIGAIANSQGGTLFFGVQDKTKYLDGCPKILKGRESLKDWLEKCIPTWFDFRLHSFRVNEVSLTPETRERIGDDRCVLYVDIWDGGTLPHQRRSDRQYFYREGSNSVVAPHHYLAYLHSSRLPAMSEKVRAWCTGFLNPLVQFLRLESLALETKEYRAISQQVEGDVVRPSIRIFNAGAFAEFFDPSNLPAKQYFFTFPNDRNRLLNLHRKAVHANVLYWRAYESIGESLLLEDFCRTHLATRFSDRTGYQVPESANSVFRETAGNFGLSLTNASPDAVRKAFCELIGEMVLWEREDINVIPPVSPQVSKFVGDFRKVFTEDRDISEAIDEFLASFDELTDETRAIWKELDRQRDELTSLFGTTYF